MHITTDRALVPAGAPAVRYLLVQISAPSKPAGSKKRPPVSVALVLDRSGSMDGSKMTMAKDAAAHALKLLSPADYVGIACYDEEVSTVLDRTHATKEAKKLAFDRLAHIHARGSTDLHGGWQRGAELATSAEPSENAIAKVMLLTDGLANQGVIDHELLVAAAKWMRLAGIATSTFGVGADFDENLLSRLAVEGGGHFYFIERAQQIPDFFASELGETLEVVVRDAALELACDPGVEAMVLNELPVERRGDRLRVSLGNLVADQEISILLAVAFKGVHEHGAAIGVEVAMDDRGHVLPRPAMAVRWDVVEGVRDLAQPINKDVLVEVATLISVSARRAALAANAAGNFDEAKRIIQVALSDLRTLAPGDPRIVRIIDQLHREELGIGEAMSPMLRKAKHFDAYQAIYSREAGGTARRSKRRHPGPGQN